MTIKNALLLRATRKERQLSVGPLWWSDGGQGYTDQLEDAGRYTRAQAAGHVEAEGVHNLAIETEVEAQLAYDGRVIRLALSPRELELIQDALHEAETEKSLDIKEGFTDSVEHAKTLQRLIEGWSALQAKLRGGYIHA